MRIVTPAAVVEGVMKVKVGKKAPFLSKIQGGFPYLRGYNLTTARGGSATPVLISDRGDPVLAMWKQGKGRSVAFTSDVKARWASPWVKWKGYAKFWNALIRSLIKADVAASGGRLDPGPGDLWKEEEKLRAMLAFWPWALLAFLVLLPIDLAVRRLNFR